MKKIVNLLVVLILSLVVLIFVASCGNNNLSLYFYIDGDEYYKIDITEDGEIVFPADPTKEGYSFSGWFIDKNVWTQQITENSLQDTQILQDTLLHAKFEISNFEHSHIYDSNNVCETRTCTLCDCSISPVHDYSLVETYEAANLFAYGTGRYKCSLCQNVKIDSITPVELDSLDIPIINFNGSLDGISKENTVTIDMAYQSKELNFECVATLKVQGATSAAYPKKNFTAKFYKDNTLEDKYKVDFGWGKENKYCMKANWIDVSQARNIVSAKLFADIIDTRDNPNQDLMNVVNHGVVDGFPVIVYLNNEFYGLYTMNIPKDSWMMGMDGDSDTRQAILMAESWTNSCALREPIESDFSNGWELEYSSTDDETWVIESFNSFIDFLINNDGADLRNGLSGYLDVNAAIDAMIFTYYIAAMDNTAKNVLWATYDGVQWFPSMYDMDGTYGLFWNGEFAKKTNDFIPKIVNGEVSLENNLLWKKLFDNYREEIKERYFELRKSVLSVDNVEDVFEEFFSLIPDVAYESDADRWSTMPSIHTNNINQIITFIKERVVWLDGFFEQL